MASHVLEREFLRENFIPITVEAYQYLAEKNLISENAELIEGVIVKKMSKSPIHYSLTQKLMLFFQNKISSKYWIRPEGPILGKGSVPEPDLAIVDFREDFYATAHPSFAHLVIEISLSTIAFDRDKADIYASAKIPEYWIFNLQNKTLEVFQNPSDDKYQLTTVLTVADSIHPLFHSEIILDLKDFL
ncbi:MAG: Uma2 family endonuclease [Leptospiraceae bacterium]|nr:Uma2 family endonuclease [Leptospiraceae bacterium]